MRPRRARPQVSGSAPTRRGWPFVLAIIFSLMHGLASGMTIEVHGRTLFATGPVTDDLPRFVDAFAQNPGIDTVVFVNSPGGDLWAGLAVGRFIAQKALRTVVAGTCESACSLMFIGGRERRFADAFRPARTWVGIHGAHLRESRTVNTTISPQLREFYRTHMGANFNEDLIEKALNDMDDHTAMLRIADASRPGSRVPHHCRNGRLPFAQCTQYPHATALSLGVVTEAAAISIELPASMRERAVAAGRTYVQPISELNTFLAEIGERRCPSADCKAGLTNLASQGPLRAVATPLDDRRGLGWVSGRETYPNALLGAVYQCNHPRGGTAARLCNIEMLGDFDAREGVAAGLAEHRAARARMTVPQQEHFASEEFRGDSDVRPALRVDNYQDLTPRSIAGVRTFSTRALAAALVAERPPVLIDVTVADQAIAGAQVIAFGGLAFADAAREAAFSARFNGLLRAMVPDLRTPVVFYCTGRNCWFSVNAVARALRMGYESVGWYRGGLEAWLAAGLPTAPPVIQAVAN